MNFVEVNTRFGKRLVDIDHIVFIRPPREGHTCYTLIFDIFDYDNDDRMEYFNLVVTEPPFEEFMQKVGKTEDKTNTLLEKIYKTIIRRMK